MHGRAVIVVEMERLDPRAISGQKVPFRVIPVMMPAVVAESHPLGIGQAENGVEIWQVPEVFKGKTYFQPFRPVDDAPDAVQAARRAGQIFAGKMDDERRDFKGGTVGDTLQVEIFRRLAVERVAPDVVLQREGRMNVFDKQAGLSRSLRAAAVIPAAPEVLSGRRQSPPPG